MQWQKPANKNRWVLLLFSISTYRWLCQCVTVNNFRNPVPPPLHKPPNLLVLLAFEASRVDLLLEIRPGPGPDILIDNPIVVSIPNLPPLVLPGYAQVSQILSSGLILRDWVLPQFVQFESIALWSISIPARGLACGVHNEWSLTQAFLLWVHCYHILCSCVLQTPLGHWCPCGRRHCYYYESPRQFLCLSGLCPYGPRGWTVCLCWWKYWWQGFPWNLNADECRETMIE